MTPESLTLEKQRRRFERLPIEVRVIYEHLDEFFGNYSSNVSRGGLFIKSTDPLPNGTEFRLVLRLPNRSEALMLVGRVKWTRGRDGGTPGMGVEFLWQDEAQQCAFENLLEALSGSEPRP